MTGRGFWLCSTFCLMLYDCGSGSRFAPRKPDPTKGTVSGTVICADTGKPARFATVELLPSPNSAQGENAPSEELAVTDLEGKFKIEAVTPGEYFAYATLDGYLNPVYGVDFDRVTPDADDREQRADVIDQWREHLTQISVSARNATDFTIQIERGAEVTGTVSYDDGSPAIGMRFAVYRKSAQGGWSAVGSRSSSDFSLEEKSDARGRFVITNLPAGEYVVCTLLPGDNQPGSAQVCLGNTFRKGNAHTVSPSPGDSVRGADIVIPLHAIHSVAGSLVQAIRNQPPSKARVHLLYADDREEAMAVNMFDDGTFLFPFVPEGSYILQVTDAVYSEPSAMALEEGTSNPPAKECPLAAREMAVPVNGEIRDIRVPLVDAPRKAAGKP
jgi:hypothetical protein